MGQGFISKYILKDIADYIRRRKGTTEEIKPINMRTELDSIPTYEQGKQAEWNAFWDAYQENGKPTYLGFMFAGAGWKPETFYPKYNLISNRYGCSSMFYMFDYRGRGNGKPPLNLEERLNELGITINLSQSFSPSNMFYMSNINVVPELDFSTFTGMDYIFYYADRVITIRKLIVSEQASWREAFTNATSLENITFEGTIGRSVNFQNCPLSVESMKSIIDHLKVLDEMTSEGWSQSLYFNDECWERLDASGQPYEGYTDGWKTYVSEFKHWNT